MAEPFYTCCEDGMRSQVPPTDSSGLCPACQPRPQLERWGRVKRGGFVGVERMADGYWTPWHVAQQALDAASEKAPHSLIWQALQALELSQPLPDHADKWRAAINAIYAVPLGVDVPRHEGVRGQPPMGESKPK